MVLSEEPTSILERARARMHESPVTNKNRQERSFFAVITKKIRGRNDKRGGRGMGNAVVARRAGKVEEGRRKERESVMAEGSGAYKWHEWKRSFPRIMRGPRGVGFQENADCFVPLTLPFPSISIPSIRLSPHPIPAAAPLALVPRYQSSTSSTAEMYVTRPMRPFYAWRACV